MKYNSLLFTLLVLAMYGFWLFQFVVIIQNIVLYILFWLVAIIFTVVL
jgi:hypothetical protein